MDFRPDVLVMQSDLPDVALVAEIKANMPDLKLAEAQLKEYMLARQCPVGMIVTSERTWIYHDMFTDAPGESVAKVGEFATSELLQLRVVPSAVHELRRAVQAWLERVASGWSTALPQALDIRERLLAHLVPAVIDGRVRAGVPSP